MSIALNHQAVSRAESLIHAGKIDHDDTWTAPEHPEPNDGLAIHTDATEGTQARIGYPIIAGGKVSRKGVIAAKSRAAQQGAGEIESAASRLLGLIDARSQTMSRSFVLCASMGGYRPALTLGQGLETEVNGQPVKYFWKDAISVGSYRHPSTGQEINVTPERMNKWIENFHRMSRNGVKVYVPVNHSRKTQDNRGWIIDARKNGDRLELLHKLIGADAALDAARSEVSLQITPGMTDGLGNVYDEAIEHCSLVVDPVIPGQNGFTPALAASRGEATDAPLFILAANSNPGGSTMAVNANELQSIKDCMGSDAPGDMTADNAVSHIVAHVKKLKGKVSMSRSADDFTAIERERDQLKAQVAQLSRSTTPTDPEALADRADLTVGKIELAAERGDIPMSLAKKLIGAVKPKDGKPNVFLLSRQAEINARPIEWVLSQLEGEKLGARTGEHTRMQLSRDIPDHGGAEYDPEKDDLLKRVRAESAARNGGK